MVKLSQIFQSHGFHHGPKWVAKLVGCCRNKLRFGGVFQPNWWSVAEKLWFCAQLLLMYIFARYIPFDYLFLTFPEEYCILSGVDSQKFLLELLYNISTLYWDIWNCNERFELFESCVNFQSDVLYFVFRYGCYQLEYPYHPCSYIAKNIESIFPNKLERHIKVHWSLRS